MEQQNNTEPPKQDTPDAHRKTDAEIFLEFHCAELKDLGKHFLTLISAVLAFSVTFSEKITDFSKSSSPQKTLLVSSWLFLIIAVVTSGAGLYYNFVAGAQAHGGIIREIKTDFKSICAADLSFV